MLACMAGWFVCALFASVAFNWTFYYLLGAGRHGARRRPGRASVPTRRRSSWRCAEAAAA